MTKHLLMAALCVASCTHDKTKDPTNSAPAPSPTPTPSTQTPSEQTPSPSGGGAAAIPVVDSVEITTVVDNYYDFFQKDENGAKRVLLAEGSGWDDVRLQAEMGLAFFIKVKAGGKEHVILYDFGLSDEAYENNLQHLHLDGSKVDALVLSHGHGDHYAGIYSASKATKAPLYVGGEDVFAHRVFTPPGHSVDFGTLDRAQLEKTSKIIIAKTPTVIASSALSTGEIPHVTDYEKVPPSMKMEKDGKLIQDPLTHEQALIFNVKGLGLVIVTSCAHAGIVNTIEYAKKITKENRVLAVLGGMHLTTAPDDVIDKTVAAIKAENPVYVSPMHCTGQRAVAKFQSQMPEAYIHPSVGTRYVFEGQSDKK